MFEYALFTQIDDREGMESLIGDGSIYQKGIGFSIFMDGKLRHNEDSPGKISI